MSATPDVLSPPGVLRRMAAFFYEGVLLFGVLFLAAWLWSTLTQQRHALQGQHGLQAFLFLVLGIYFSWFWSHGGQTVAMKAWHLRVVSRDGKTLSQARALVRYLLAWLWFAPALALIGLTGVRGGGPISASLAMGVMAYALLARLHPQRLFLHDLLAGTRLITQHPTARPRKH
jgi:uncharacterized RDD family membrane protein YckC